MIATPIGRTILDFGQNLVGRLRMRVAGPAGRYHAPARRGARRRRARHPPAAQGGGHRRYDLAGDGEETLGAAFTFHGFRYARSTAGRASSTGRRRGGRAAQRHAPDRLVRVIRSRLLNRLHENVVWGMRGNFLAMPTDCPQRDERLGWTGDIQVFAPDRQLPVRLRRVPRVLAARPRASSRRTQDGIVPFIVPAALPAFGGLGRRRGVGRRRDGPAVRAARALRRLGVLAAQYASMRDWVDPCCAGRPPRPVGGHTFQFGDWLDPRRRRTSPRMRRPTGTSSPPPTSRGRCGMVAAPRRCSAARRMPSTTATLAERRRAAFVAEYVTPAGPHDVATPRPPTPWRWCSTS